MPIYLHLAWSPEWAVAAAIGALLSIPLQADAKTHLMRGWHVLLNTAVGFFVAPLLDSYYHLSPPAVVAMAFLLGLFGTAITVAILRSVKTVDLLAFIRPGGSTK
jgi:hypothetical protein